MARFENLIYEADECTVKTGRKVADHVTSEHNKTRETAVKACHRVADHVTSEHNETRETAVKACHRVADHVTSEHEQTRRHIDDDADYVVDKLGGYLRGWQIFISLIMAALAGFGAWVASKGYILKDVLDANGNVVGQEPHLPYIILLVVAACAAGFYVTLLATEIPSRIARRR